MKKQLLIAAILLISSLCFAQPGETEKSKEPTKLDIVFSPGVIIQKEIFGELNIIIGGIANEGQSKIPIVGVGGLRVGFETNLKSNTDFIIAPKIGVELSAAIISMRLSAINYFKDNESEFRILPELGISLNGSVNLTYGYGISFKNTINGISNHRLGLSININKKLNSGAFF